MKSFNLCRKGINCSFLSEKITPEELIQFIQNHPQKEQIESLRRSPYKSETYVSIKKSLPYVTPHATFNIQRKIENVNSLSGFIFLDIDKDSLPHGPEPMKKYILEHHKEKVALMGTSVGGHGIFLYVRIENDKELTKENFDSVYNYVRNELFRDLPTDNNAGGLNRLHIIPADPEVYANFSASISVPDKVLENTKTLSSCNNNNSVCYTGDEKFLDIKEVFNRIVKCTTIDIGDQDVLVKEVEWSKLYVPRVITDGKKHATYRAMVNSILFNNPGIDLWTIISFINYINSYFTDGKPMNLREMKRTVEAEYNRILDTRDFKGLKIKRYHTNPKYDRDTRIRLAAKARGNEQKQKSIQLISDAVQQIKAESANRPTIKKVAELLKGKLSEATINRYWREVVPKNIVG